MQSRERGGLRVERVGGQHREDLRRSWSPIPMEGNLRWLAQERGGACHFLGPGEAALPDLDDLCSAGCHAEMPLGFALKPFPE